MMTMGPWKAVYHPVLDKPKHSFWTIQDRKNVYIAVVDNIDGLTSPDMEANVRLLAAAPDLLSALESALGELDTIAEEWDTRWKRAPRDQTPWEKERRAFIEYERERARATIAKARGS